MSFAETPSFSVTNPATGAELYKMTPSSEAEIVDIFRKARVAQEKIAAMTVQQRIQEVEKIGKYLVEHRQEVIDRILSETGKSRFDALSTEVFEVCHGIDYFVKVAAKTIAERGIHTPLMLMGKKSKVVYEPLGTVFIIAPWNYPLVQCFTPSLLAFLAGNAIVFKPSELTPLKGLYEQIIKGSGFMQDALQVVYGGRETGRQVIEMKPDKVHFTGSVRAGKEIMAQCSNHLIPVDLELGGKDPAIVFDDVNIDKTVHGVLWAAFTNTGQSCTSIERLYVQEGVYDQFLKELVAQTNRLKLAPDTADGFCEIAYMTSERQIQIIEEQLAEAVRKGAKIECGGKRRPGVRFFEPTIVTGCDHSMQVASEETFGPVIAVMKFKTEDEAIRLANDSKYGLSASVWSKDMARANRVARKLKVGNVAINNHMLTEGNPALPFGGVKDSGFGRFKGEWGLHTFCNIKAIISSPNDSKIEPHWYRHSQEKYEMFDQLVASFFARPRKWLKFLPLALKIDTIGKKQRIQ